MISQKFIKQIENFDIDGQKVHRTFAQRLAKEQSWTEEFAHQVIREYKRFVILASTSPFEITPSKSVDAAWHLHLIFTESYWDRLIPLLPKRLHHKPCTGAPWSVEKYQTQFDQTKWKYFEVFGEFPPEAIWGKMPTDQPPVWLGSKEVDLAQNLSQQPVKATLLHRLKYLLTLLGALMLVGCVSDFSSIWVLALVIGTIAVGLVVAVIRELNSPAQRRNNNGQDGSSGGCGGGGSDFGGDSSDSGSDGGDGGGGDGGGCGGCGGCGG